MRKRKVWAVWEELALRDDIRATAAKFGVDEKQLVRHLRTVILDQ